MTGFVFRLQALLELREAERDRRRDELGRAIRAEQILARQIDALQQTVQQTRRHLGRASRPGPVDVAQLLDTQRYELVLRAQIEQMQQQHQRIVDEVARRRDAVVEADRAVRVLEKLRAHRRAEYLAHQAKIEQRELDEVALRRATYRPEAKVL